MRKIKEVLRLKHEAKLSHEKIAAATGMSKGAVTNTVQRAVQKGLSWPLPADLDESRLEALLYVQAAPRLFEEFSLCHADGSFRKRLAAIAKINVLIIDLCAAHRYVEFGRATAADQARGSRTLRITEGCSVAWAARLGGMRRRSCSRYCSRSVTRVTRLRQRRLGLRHFPTG
jgi:hypothetical protein